MALNSPITVPIAEFLCDGQVAGIDIAGRAVAGARIPRVGIVEPVHPHCLNRPHQCRYHRSGPRSRPHPSLPPHW